MSNETTEQQETERETISAPKLDYDLYRGDLRDLDLTTEQENELLTILWDIMKTMVDLNLDMDAVQMVIPPSLYGIFNNETERSTDTQKDTRSKPNG